MSSAPKKPVSATPWWKNRNFLIGAGVGLIAVAAGATFALWPVDPQKQIDALAMKSPEDIRKAVDSGAVPREVAWEAFGQQREREMQQRMDTYFALKTDAERSKYLDKMIDEMQSRMREWQSRAATRPGGDPRGPGGDRRRGDGPTSQPSDDQRKEREQRRAARADATPTAQKAQRAEFMAAMRKRMEQRGIQPPGGGGRGFGFGPGGPGGPGRGGR